MIAKRIAFVFLALTAGAIGFLLLFVVGEGTNSGLAAYGACALLFGLVGYGLGRLDPKWSWLYTALAAAPVFILSFTGPDRQYIGLAVVMVVVAMLGPYLAQKRAAAPSATPPS